MSVPERPETAQNTACMFAMMQINALAGRG
jgi:hypothetical protein